MDIDTTRFKRNDRFDGDFGNTHFTTEAFNIAFAHRILVEILQTTKEQLAEGASGVITVIDIGAGSGDMLYEVSQLSASKGLSNVNFIGVDIDEQKYIEGAARRNDPNENIQFHGSNIFDFDLRQFDHPIIITQRALTHYFVNRDITKFDVNTPNTIPENYTPEQIGLMQYYLAELPPNSKIMDFISTGADVVGLRRLAYVLNIITHGKQYNFLDENAYLEMISDCRNMGKQFQVTRNILMQNHEGYRDIGVLFERYGDNLQFEDFRNIVLNAYQSACTLYPGDTLFVDELSEEDNLLFKIEYRLFTTLVKLL